MGVPFVLITEQDTSWDLGLLVARRVMEPFCDKSRLHRLMSDNGGIGTVSNSWQIALGAGSSKVCHIKPQKMSIC